MGHGGRLPAPPQKGHRRAPEQMPCCLGGAWVGAARPRAPLVAGGKRKKSHRRFQFILHGEKLLRPLSAVRLVNNERPEALLCESSASNNRARRAGRSQQIDRAIFPACGALNWLACGAFRSACGAERTRPKAAALYSPACSRGVDRVCEQMAASKSTCCCTAARFAPLSFVPASCWL